MPLKHVLVVDDERTLLSLLTEHLGSTYHVTSAESGAIAIEKFVRQRPDVVLLDISMPATSGVDVLKLFREADASVPVIMITANMDLDVTEACLKSGAFAYVPKPFRLEYLDHMVALALAQSRGPDTPDPAH